MEWIKEFGEVLLLFVVGGIFSVVKHGLKKEGKWNIWKSLTKFFVNIISGITLYVFLLSYKEWYGEYPQKIGVIMMVTYIGSRLIDLLVDKSFEGLRSMNIKDFIKHMLKL